MDYCVMDVLVANLLSYYKSEYHHRHNKKHANSKLIGDLQPVLYAVVHKLLYWYNHWINSAKQIWLFLN